MTIEVYNYPLSPCGEKVRFALAEKELAFVDHHVDLGSKDNLKPGFLRLNPKGLVPVLLDDGVAVADSTVILEYIEDRWPDRPLRPADPLGRARMRRWTKHVDEVLHPAWPGIAWPILVRPKWLAKPATEVEAMLAALLDPRRRERQKRMFDQGLAAQDARESIAVFIATCEEMEIQLAGTPWLAGEDFSLADVALLPYLVAVEIFDLARLYQRFTNVARWYAAACARSCFKGHPRTMLPAKRLQEIEASLVRSARQGSVNLAPNT
ncbi:glutathione S-transferase [Mesorhizobium sp. L-8-10]|uniref:glutathione S-transferase family protein n=1 Tax=unclassified Mesorhizobium TaxID=325217 RepID=UPI001927D165|nr:MULTISPECIES: glutathione S-transferase family protein [unclassified Mesorhizobium]BCH25279.1 glutathione S-transferase [Mesorhizobium sp. L-8-3]BCH33289.1 glutathione S-transferase [Mesorhizobium sp. L-8-10]